MSSPKHYRSFAEFEREYLRPGRRVGQSVEDLLIDSPFQREFELDRDPWAEEEEEED